MHPSNQVRRARHRPVPDRSGPVGPPPGAAGGGRKGDAVGLQGGEGVLPGVEDLRGEGPPRPPVEEEAGTTGRAIHEKSGRTERWPHSAASYMYLISPEVAEAKYLVNFCSTNH